MPFATHFKELTYTFFFVSVGVDVDPKNENSLPLWEASWDDEDQGDFSEDLKAELGKNA